MKKWQHSAQGDASVESPRQTSVKDDVQLASIRKEFFQIGSPTKPTGYKNDQGKAPLELLFLEIGEASEELARVLGMGEKKYGLNNFDSFPDAKRRYEAALLRHMSSQIKGDYIDEESGLHHTAHVAANALFLLQLHLKGK